MASDTDSGAGGAIGCLFMLGIAAYGIAQIYAGWLGISHGIGVGWAIAAVVAAFAFRFTLPMTIGAFFGAMNVWGWPWYLSLVFALPGLAFMALMIPGMLGSAMTRVRR